MNGLRTGFVALVPSIALVAACSTSSGGGSDGGTTSDGGASDGTAGNDSASNDGASSDSAGDSSDGATCDDTMPPFECPEAGVDAACGVASVNCGLLQANFKPKIAQKIETCLLGLDNMCDGNQVAMCAGNASDSACDSAAATQACTEAAAACGDAGDDGGAKFTVAECLGYAKGLSANGLQNYKNCISACGQGLGSCFVFTYQP